MLISKRFQQIFVVMMALFCVGEASAFDPSVYTRTSKLSTGKWIKITIPEDGVYEITYDELLEMGFSNPSQVKVYGYGGHPIGEVLENGMVPDDLTAVPILRTNNKICFFGNGPVAYSISNYQTFPHFTRKVNSYSQVGCYFLTETSGADTKPSKKPSGTATELVDVSTGMSFFIHENELFSVGNSGKDMLGEEFTGGKVMIDYRLPGIADSTIVLHSSLAAYANQMSYAAAVIHSGGATDTTAYRQSASCIDAPITHTYYNTASPYDSLKLTHPAEVGQYEPRINFTDSADLLITLKCLDYFIITYKRENVIKADENNQILISYVKTEGNERFLLPNAASSVVVWNIDNTRLPKVVATTPYDDQAGQGLAFTVSRANVSTYMVFDPAQTLKKISSYTAVENQNLHGLSTPDMLIITSKAFLEQAQRLADMHTAVDGIDVVVVDQEQVFNEFSSGTRDIMAYRLFCKMLYDRDVNKDKFKNLLLFGTGNFDNRELLGEHPNNLLTYQSDVSYHEDFSYTTDDFIGQLDDGAGTNPITDVLRIGVGRITCHDVQEAKSDVDKIVEYYATPDYGVWRNNVMVATDAPNNGQYMFFGEGYKNLIDDGDQNNMHVNTVHNSMYPRSNNEESFSVSRRTATEAKQQWSQFMSEGAYFATYSGHAGPTVFTQTSNLWTIVDVVGTAYPHWPIMSTACCDVAHYDNDSRGIAEVMFHKRNGGAVALLTSSRMVYATSNDRLNQNFINALYAYPAIGRMRTLGEAYMLSKQNTASTSGSPNKLQFFLLGDPAIKFNYPISRFKVTKVNGTAMADSLSSASINPLSRFEIEAQVLDSEGNLDNTFNGNAAVTLYDKEDLFTSVSMSVDGVMTSRDIYFNRPKLAEATGRVTNGVFTGSLVAPQSVLAENENVLLRIYAHKDNTDYMVNGATRQITMLPYDGNVAITDNNAPVISAMYINDEDVFSSGAAIGTSGMLYITVTDNEAINVQSNSVDRGMSLSLDGGKFSYTDIGSCVTVTDNGKAVGIEFPLTDLPEGMHSLTYTVFDVSGNMATKTVKFMVGTGGTAALMADKWPAYKGDVVAFELQTEMEQVPEFTVRVTDATGKLVWMTKTTSFPVAWDMKDMNGQLVPAGLYRYFGTFVDGSNSGGTSINKLIVLDPLKTAAE